MNGETNLVTQHRTPSRVSRAWRGCTNLLFKRIILVLVILFALGVGGLLWHQNRLHSRLIESTALQEARRHTEALAEFRTQYTAKVVETVRAQNIEVTHDYDVGEKKGKAIPLPATLSMELGNAIAKRGDGGQTLLYSAFPFPYPGRKQLRDRDQFEQDAWIQLRKDPSAPFYRFEEFQGRPALRYATADLMRKACVNCHNTHPDTPKSDWKEGDVRGVLEVTFPLDRAIGRTRANLQESLFLMVGLAVAGLLILALLIGRLRRAPAELEAAVRDRTRRLSEANESSEREIRERRLAQERLAQQTGKLERSNAELEQFNRLAVGRELRMIELKRQINELCKAVGKEPPYDLSRIELEGGRGG